MGRVFFFASACCFDVLLFPLPAPFPSCFLCRLCSFCFPRFRLGSLYLIFAKKRLSRSAEYFRAQVKENPYSQNKTPNKNTKSKKATRDVVVATKPQTQKKKIKKQNRCFEKRKGGRANVVRVFSWFRVFHTWCGWEFHDHFLLFFVLFCAIPLCFTLFCWLLPFIRMTSSVRSSRRASLFSRFCFSSLLHVVEANSCVLVESMRGATRSIKKQIQNNPKQPNARGWRAFFCCRCASSLSSFCYSVVARETRELMTPCFFFAFQRKSNGTHTIEPQRDDENVRRNKIEKPHTKTKINRRLNLPSVTTNALLISVLSASTREVRRNVELSLLVRVFFSSFV